MNKRNFAYTIILLLLIFGLKLFFSSKNLTPEHFKPKEILNPYIHIVMYAIYGTNNIKIYNQNGDVKLKNLIFETSCMDHILELKEVKQLLNDKIFNRHSEFEKCTVEVNFNDKEFIIQTKFHENTINAKVDLTIRLMNSKTQVDEICTTNGNIFINDITKDIKATTDSGEIEVINSKCFVELYNKNGNINVIDTEGITSIIVDNGTINAEIQNITSETKLINKNGNINIKVPHNLNANIEIEADEKSIKNQTNFLKLSKYNNIFKGSIGSGSNLMRIKAINGQINIDEKVTFSLNKPK